MSEQYGGLCIGGPLAGKFIANSSARMEIAIPKIDEDQLSLGDESTVMGSNNPFPFELEVYHFKGKWLGIMDVDGTPKSIDVWVHEDLNKGSLAIEEVLNYYVKGHAE